MEKTRVEKHVYNLSAQVFSSYLILLNNNVKNGRTILEKAEQAGEDEKTKPTEAAQKEARSQFFGVPSLYNAEISFAISEAQYSQCLNLLFCLLGTKEKMPR